VDGVIDVENKQESTEWISHEGEGAMLKLEWDEEIIIDKIRMYDSPAEISFPPKKVRWVKFTITKGSADISTATTLVPGKRLGISEIEVFEARE